MRILLTNDDGIMAKGIQTLCECLSTIAEISVVAPESERSATSHGITLRQPIMVRDVPLNSGKVMGYAISGTPADCVKLAIQGKLVPEPDIVISGINQGQNLGTDVLYSGTVSAAIEGALNGKPAIAVSLTSYEYDDFTGAAEFTRKLCLYLQEQGISQDTLLNVNVPPVPATEIKGVRVTKLCSMQYVNVFEARVDPKGRKYFWQGGEVFEEECPDQETDYAAIKDREISITPIHFDLTNYRIMDEIKQWKMYK
ncbi:MAG TPA: 5'/3'-nucleotidase SurE [Desulfobacteria bacterium]|nr:5'/3'-nucleotidase SurE [Desulfobacteria bacterium]